MKAITVIALLMLIAGCASQPMTFEQRMAIANYMQRGRYVLPPPPQMAPIPQSHNYLCYVNGNYVSCTRN